MNKFNELAFRNKNQSLTQEIARNGKIMSMTTGFNQSKISKEPIVVPMLYRSKSSYPGSMENDI